jgi:hypothetical protein
MSSSSSSSSSSSQVSLFRASLTTTTSRSSSQLLHRVQQQGRSTGASARGHPLPGLPVHSIQLRKCQGSSSTSPCPCLQQGRVKRCPECAVH